MHRHTCLPLILTALLAAGSSWSEQEQTNAEHSIRLTVDLSDGSRIIGTPLISSIPFQTPYAKMEIPLKQMASIKIEDDHENASIEMANGDKLKGVLNLARLELTTIFGKLSVGVEHTKSIAVRTNAAGTSGADAVAALRSGLIAYYPFDGDIKDYGQTAGNNLSAQDGNVSTTNRGKVGGACSFSGSGAHLRGAVPASALGADWTIAAWFTHESPVGWEAIISFNPDWSQSPVMTIKGGSTEFGINRVGVGDAGVFVDLGPDHYGKWVFAVITLTAGNHVEITAYVDGRLKTNSGNLSWALGRSPQFYVGRHLEPYQIWNGLIDEVGIWNRALSPSEISDLYSDGHGMSLMPKTGTVSRLDIRQMRVPFR